MNSAKPQTQKAVFSTRPANGLNQQLLLHNSVNNLHSCCSVSARRKTCKHTEGVCHPVTRRTMKLKGRPRKTFPHTSIKVRLRYLGTGYLIVHMQQ